ncbi:hypothetical protein MKW98_010491 [Papaver atlanticum]|uniref:Uncharacterized protein n=1 Tax=Papaver atlanticum TaxID=357466 RepID=A0AAD4T8B4_9MAGN|nr:hypothetical protein MKW98_010491 [Papaver atlanticum]
MGETAYCSSSSSEEEDGDAEWRATINYIATDVSNQSASSNGLVPKTSNRTSNSEEQPKPKHYVVKVQKLLLENMLDKSLDMVNAPIPECGDEPAVDEGGGIRLFRHAPLGIVFDPVDDSKLPRKRPKILPGYEVDEKSKKQFKRQLKSIAVDGVQIIASARDACKKSLARLEAKDVAAKAKAKREEERVAEMEKIRGKKWLPSIARHMRVSFQAC